MIGNPDKMSLRIALCKRRRVMRSKPGFRIVLFERRCGTDRPRSRIYFASHCPNEDSELIWWTGNRMALCKRQRVMGSRPGFRIVLFERRCGTAPKGTICLEVGFILHRPVRTVKYRLPKVAIRFETRISHRPLEETIRDGYRRGRYSSKGASLNPFGLSLLATH